MSKKLTLKDLKKKWKEEEGKVRDKERESPSLKERTAGYYIGWANCLEYVLRELTEAKL